MLLIPFNIKMPDSGRTYRDITICEQPIFDIKIYGENHSTLADGYIIGTAKLSKKPDGVYLDGYTINDEYTAIFDDVVNMRLNPETYKPIFRIASIGSEDRGEVSNAEAKFVFIWVKEMNEQILRDLRLKQLNN